MLLKQKVTEAWALVIKTPEGLRKNPQIKQMTKRDIAATKNKNKKLIHRLHRLHRFKEKEKQAGEENSRF